MQPFASSYVPDDGYYHHRQGLHNLVPCFKVENFELHTTEGVKTWQLYQSSFDSPILRASVGTTATLLLLLLQPCDVRNSVRLSRD